MPSSQMAKSGGLDGVQFLVRVALGAVVLFHGVFKLQHGVEWVKGPLGEVGLPGVLAYGLYLAEVAAPVLVILGLFSRPAALVIAFDMAMAMLLVLRGRVFSINPQGGGWAIELEFLILVMAVAVTLQGAGRYGLGRGRPPWD